MAGLTKSEQIALLGVLGTSLSDAKNDDLHSALIYASMASLAEKLGLYEISIHHLLGAAQRSTSIGDKVRHTYHAIELLKLVPENEGLRKECRRVCDPILAKQGSS